MTAPSSSPSSSANLESLVSQLLQEVGVLPKEDSDNNQYVDVFDRMDQWLGLSEPANDEDLMESTVEDCAPFSPHVYSLVATMVQECWNPSNTSLPNNNVLIQELQHLQDKGITKEEDLIKSLKLTCIPAIRVTRWIRQWMEYNVQAPEKSTVSDKSFSYHLLMEHADSYSTETLFQSLFVHWTLLPTYQSQLLLFNQAFQRGDFTSSNNPTNNKQLPQTKTTALSNPTHRLLHYQLSQQLANRLNAEYQTHVEYMETILGDWYSVAVPLRPLARAGLSRVWMKFCLNNASGAGGGGISLKGENTTASGLDATLRVLYRILLGMKQESNTNIGLWEDLLFHQLLPLHQPNAMVLWRDQTSLLELYHEPLVQCMAFILKQQPQWIPPVCQALVLSSESIWPTGGNTPKQVLLLHEVDTFLGMLMDCENNVMEESVFISILSAVSQCMASEHSRLAERALALMRNAYFKKCVMETFLEASLKVLLPALTRSTKASITGDELNTVPWNPTVRKMTFHVLKNLQNNNEEVFAKVCNQLFGDGPIIPKEPAVQDIQPPKKSPILLNKSNQQQTDTKPGAYNQRFSLQAGMGDWRPPPSNKGRHNNMPPPSARPPKGSNNPPSTITGVAPWAVSKNPPSTVTGVAPWAVKPQANPPSNVTGVAPWANKTNKGSKLPLPSKTNPPGKGKAPWTNGLLPSPSARPPTSSTVPKSPSRILPPSPKETAPAVPTESSMPTPIDEGEEEEEEQPETTESETASKNNPGLAHVLSYMEKCKPPGMDENEDEHASSAWSKAQMAETPTLLPELKFHDLVFGQELGKGAFGVVKYARLIDRTKTRSNWAEYAVKVIATERMKELGYEYSVAREIASLRLISHPNVARLVSSFRFQQGAYLVLEYASGGDLHQLLQQHGSLDVASSQFVIGEVVAALASLHEDLGFVYGDLKPENIVISETGHVKLTDFGACRPFTENAKANLLRQMGKSGKNLLETLREGDPRKLNKQSTEEQKESIWETTEEEETDEPGWAIMEGTTKEKEELDSRVINDDTMEVIGSSENNTHKEDMRIEGTTAYLPPEVVLGNIPTPAADSWALGCVLYQCMSGRPPILEADDSQTRSRIVTFDSKECTQTDSLFGQDQKHAADIPDAAKALIRSLLDRVAHKRPSMQQTAQHEFFDGQDVMRLYQKQAYPLDVGGVAPAPPDAQWSRRQFSSIWAPQPQAYDISGTVASNNSPSTQKLSAPISEGDEAGASFTPNQFYRVGNLQQTKGTSPPSGGEGDLAQQLPHIEEDDVSMASSTEERMTH